LGAQLQALLGISAKYFPGLKVSYIPISPTQGDYSPIVATANQNSGFVMATDAPTLVHFLQTAKQQGVKKPTSISSVILLQGNTVKQLGPLATSLYSPGGFLPAADTSSKAVVKFNAAMNAVNKKASKDDFSEDAYLGVELFADVAKGMKNVTGPAVAAKLDQLDGLSLGLLPPIQFTTPDKSFGPLDRIFNPDVVYMQINKAGKALPTTGSFVNAFSGANPTKP
ncbi:MAG TPA: ABC transporter substrate-binding protein, partial [Acidimicrobiales bacterium]|nr:ABC transporter substrate-binding protein [Acidimicrobiales bacterium]